MRYVNNWITQLSADFGAAATAVPLPSVALGRLAPGEYLLTLVNSANPTEQTSWEILKVTVASGVATAVRGQEGTQPQAWALGALIYCAVTAGAMNQLMVSMADLLRRVALLESGGIDPPDPQPDGALVDEQGNTLVDDQGNTLTGA